MSRKEKVAAAKAEFFRLIREEGLTPRQARVQLDKWGKAKFGAVDWKSIIALLLPIFLKWLSI